ncbi:MULTISPECIES: hypothetical protein [Gammaproteobacteria]|uniref:hypothetical protein n=1 Tax=Gammaproteobacteria TaxID=1236 RepID=UPI000DD09756|nr:MULTISPECIES: hypothetical protein [Gammaproteobacteria]RTE87349.1 hypothetical protein DQX04_02895 [Aliidiomarina sp. B3213]TCZ92865.1 hypothetical protein EYQ95_02410 [Lysobacter sp. N42]
MKTAITMLTAFVAATSIHVNATEQAMETFSNVEYCELANAMGPTRTNVLRAYSERLGYQPTRQECKNLHQSNAQTAQFELESEVRSMRRTSSIRIPSQTLESMKQLPNAEQQIALEQVITRSAPF